MASMPSESRVTIRPFTCCEANSLDTNLTAFASAAPGDRRIRSVCSPGFLGHFGERLHNSTEFPMTWQWPLRQSKAEQIGSWNRSGCREFHPPAAMETGFGSLQSRRPHEPPTLHTGRAERRKCPACKSAVAVPATRPRSAARTPRSRAARPRELPLLLNGNRKRVNECRISLNMQRGPTAEGTAKRRRR